MLERDIVTAIKKYLASLGRDVFFWKEHGGPYGCAGIPDIICCYRGKFVAFEVKTETGKTTALQESVINKIQKCGGKAAVVRSVENVKAALKEMVV